MAERRRRQATRLRGLVARCVAVLVALAGLSTVLTASPAGADPLASVSAIVNRPLVDGLLSLCITSHTLDPNGTCLTIGSTPPSAGSGGTASAITSTGFGSISFYYNGQITLGGRTFHGTASGVAAWPHATAFTTTIQPFSLTGTDSSDTLSATCSGQWQDTGTTGIGVGAARSVLTCNGSVNGGPPGTSTLVAAYALTSESVVPYNTEAAYSGVFGGL